MSETRDFINEIIRRLDEVLQDPEPRAGWVRESVYDLKCDIDEVLKKNSDWSGDDPEIEKAIVSARAAWDCHCGATANPADGGPCPRCNEFPTVVNAFRKSLMEAEHGVR